MKPALIAGVLIFLAYVATIEATWWQYQGHDVVPLRIKRSEDEPAEDPSNDVPKGRAVGAVTTAAPKPGSGTSPKPGNGTSPKPGNGTSPKPGNGTAPSGKPGTTKRPRPPHRTTASPHAPEPPNDEDEPENTNTTDSSDDGPKVFEDSSATVECPDKNCCKAGQLDENDCTSTKDPFTCKNSQGCQWCERAYLKCNSIWMQYNYLCHGTPPTNPLNCSVGSQNVKCDTDPDPSCSTAGQGNNKTCPKPTPIDIFPGGKDRNLTITMNGSAIDPNIVDIYYLVDFSISTRMDNQREQMFKYGEALYKKFKDEGKDVRMGLGSFVDKELAEARTTDDEDEKPGTKKSKGDKKKPKKFDLNKWRKRKPGHGGGKNPNVKSAGGKDKGGKHGRKKRAGGKPPPPKKDETKADEAKPTDEGDEHKVGKDGRHGEATDDTLDEFHPGHSYKNYINISTDYDEFVKELKLLTKQETAYGEVELNRFTKESQLEALAQIALCSVGWREKSTRILVVMTDGGFHEKEEDAKNKDVGKDLPDFDSQCHMDADNTYGKTLELKYPSIEQIHKVLEESRLNVLVSYFRTNKTDHGPEKWMRQYKEDTKQWSDFANSSAQPMRLWVWNTTDTDGLTKEVDEVVTAGSEHEFKRLLAEGGTFKISLAPDSGSLPGLELKYYSACETEEVKQTDVCHKMTSNNTINWIIEFSMKECPQPPAKSVTHYKFNVTGIPYETELDVEQPCNI